MAGPTAQPTTNWLQPATSSHAIVVGTPAPGGAAASTSAAAIACQPYSARFASAPARKARAGRVTASSAHGAKKTASAGSGPAIATASSTRAIVASKATPVGSGTSL